MSKYLLPQYYTLEDRINLIQKELSEGNSFYQIGQMFGGVSSESIKYHYKRYIQKVPFKKKKPLKKELDYSSILEHFIKIDKIAFKLHKMGIHDISNELNEAAIHWKKYNEQFIL